MKTEWICIPYLAEYNHILEIMHQRVNDVIDRKKGEIVLVLQHQDVYTAGTSASTKELLNNNIPVIYTGRGGKWTYHSSGQVVAYPIINLNREGRSRDVRLYIKNLEEWIIASLCRVGLKSYTVQDKIGVWINKPPAKIAAIGVRIRKWVTYHGIAINVSNDLEGYRNIIPCGINDLSVTSLRSNGISIRIEDFIVILKDEFHKVFD